MMAEQSTLILTAHPLQRIGAFALCALGGASEPARLAGPQFDHAVERMIQDAISAGLATSTGGGLWRKASHAIFPNNAWARGLRLRREHHIANDVRLWRGMPVENAWPRAACVLCGRTAVGFYGGADIATAGKRRRGTAARRQDGLALCWPCLCSFRALPYGCALTSGTSAALHSFHDEFLAAHVARQVRANATRIAFGRPPDASDFGLMARAVRQVRRYENRFTVGVELMLLRTSNRGQALGVHRLDQPIAEWLRQSRQPAHAAGFAALVRAHRSAEMPGFEALAHRAFDSPDQILGQAASFVVGAVDRAGSAPLDIVELAGACRSYAHSVLRVGDDETKHVEALASDVAAILSSEMSRSPLLALLHAATDSVRLRAELQAIGASCPPSQPLGAAGLAVTSGQGHVLFGSDRKSQTCRQLLTIAVLERLDQRGWRATDAAGARREWEAGLLAQATLDEHAMRIDEDDPR